MGPNPIGAWNLLLSCPCAALDEKSASRIVLLPVVWLNYKEYTVTMKRFHV